MSTNDPATVTDDPGAPGRRRLVLSGRVTVARADALHRAALALVERGTDVAIDCSAVEYLDVAAVQVLVALEREVTRRGHRGALVGVPATLAADFRLLGLGGAKSAAATPAAPTPSPAPPPSSPLAKWEQALRTVAEFSPPATN